MYKINKISPSIFHFEFVKMIDMFLAFMRLSEYYECPDNNIKGKKFTLEDLIAAYAELSNGEFKYMDDFSAFNIPDYAIKGFMNKMGDDLLNREKKVIKDIKKTLDDDESNPAPKTYYIATYTQNNPNHIRDLRHETAHGLFYSQSMYREIMLSLIDGNKPLMEKIYNRLRKMSYCEEVLLDEAQAYLATSSLQELKDFDFPNLKEKDILPFRKTFASFTINVKQKKKGIIYVRKQHENNGGIGKQQTIR